MESTARSDPTGDPAGSLLVEDQWCCRFRLCQGCLLLRVLDVDRGLAGDGPVVADSPLAAVGVAVAAVQAVDPFLTAEVVVTAEADQDVVALATDQFVVVEVALEQVVGAAAGDALDISVDEVLLAALAVGPTADVGQNGPARAPGS